MTDIDFESTDQPDQRLGSDGEFQFDGAQLEGYIEALIFASPRPISVVAICEILNEASPGAVEQPHVQSVIDRIKDHYDQRQCGFYLCEVIGNKYQFQTRQEHGRLMRGLFADAPRPLSRAALETLATIAYRQPVTRAQVDYIRGVDSGSIIKNLMERDLVHCVGRKDVIGKPMLFATTTEFLEVFGIQKISELPPLSSFQPDVAGMNEALEKIESIDHPVLTEEMISGSEEGE